MFALSLVFFAAPAPVVAAECSPAQTASNLAQIQTLLAQISSSSSPIQQQILRLQIQILQLQISGCTTTPEPGGGDADSCLDITHNLVLGSRDANTGGDVSRLQKFLGGEVTGFFGVQTMKLVSAWQSAHGIPAIGTVGPITRAAMIASCEEDTDTGSEEAARAALADARDAVEDAQDYYEQAVEDGDIPNYVLDDAKDDIDEALDELDEAQEAYEEGDYELAYDSAQSARGWAESAIERLDAGTMSVSVRSVTGANVSIAYENLPSGYMSILWQGSAGFEEVTQSPYSSGSGTLVIEMPPSAPSGSYIARAYRQGTGTVLEQSSLFGYSGSTTSAAFSYSLLNKSADPGESWVEGADMKYFVLKIHNPSSATKNLTFPTNCWWTYRIYDRNTGRVVFNLADEQECMRVGSSAATTFALKPGESKTLEFDHLNSLYRLSPGSYVMRIDVNSRPSAPSAASFNFGITAGVSQSVTIAEKTYASTTPFIEGTSSGVTSFGISVDNGEKVYGSGNSAIVPQNGSWRHRISAPLANGWYNVKAYSTSNVLIGSGKFRVQVGTVATTTLGTYVGYMNGAQFIRTENISESDALANCRLNASNNPTKTVRCTWNGREIYNGGPSLPTPHPIISLAATPTSVAPGGLTTLTWNVQNATSCLIRGKGISETSVDARSGRLALKPKMTTTYTMRCENAPGAGREGEAGETSVTVYVYEYTTTPPTTTPATAPTTVPTGSTNDATNAQQESLCQKKGVCALEASAYLSILSAIASIQEQLNELIR